MDSDSELAIKKIKLMNPYVQLNKAFLINSMPGIAKQFNNEATADVKVVLGITDQEEDTEDIETTTLYLHKIVLSSGSPMFSAWLGKYTESDGISVLKIPEKSVWMPDFFRYFYTGQLMMTSENIVDIYMVADKYLVETLKMHCEDNIRENLKIKVEKNTCTHIRSMLNRYDEEDSIPASTNTSSSTTEPPTIFHPYQSFLRSRCAISTSNSVNIFSNFNHYSSTGTGTSKSTTTPLCSSSAGGCISSNCQGGTGNVRAAPNIFNSSSGSAGNMSSFSKNPFSRSVFDLFNNPSSDIESLTARVDLFCEKCSQGPLTVSRVLAFHTVVRLAQITNNSDLRKLALYNLIIRLTEELRAEDYSNFVQLPFPLLCDLLEDDNFYCPEFYMYCGVKQWIESANAAMTTGSNCSSEPGTIRQRQSDQLWCLLRLPLLSVSELYDVECSARASGFFTDSVLHGQLYQTMRYVVYRGLQKAKLATPFGNCTGANLSSESLFRGALGTNSVVSCRVRVPVDIVKTALQP